MPYDRETGAWIPARRNSQGIKCAVCKRVFAGEYVPVDRVCRDCRGTSPAYQLGSPLPLNVPE